MTATSFDTRKADLRARHDQLVAAEPKLRARDRASRLGVSEAELIAAECGEVQARPLNGEFEAIFKELGGLGEVMALSRNDWCVHERTGRYESIEITSHVGLVLGPDIDLRVFFGGWRFAFSVTEGGRRSLQFFDKTGVAVHKVYLLEGSDHAAFDALVDKYAAAAPAWPEVEPAAAPAAQGEVADPAGLREAWRALKDTHDFFPMLRKFKASRLGALRAAGAELAQEVPNDVAERMLTSVAASGLPIMVFVSNPGMVQIHTGKVEKLLRTGPWFNVLDPRFNLHLNTEAIASTWIVNKPTEDGWVTSIEVYAASGELIVQFFGERKPGKPELADWRHLLQAYCPLPLAA